MRRISAVGGSAIFLVVAPGAVGGLVPWWLTGWRVEEPLPHWGPLRVVGGLLAAAGAAVLLAAFLRFALEGRGTPAPVAPTEELVVGGPYRHVRNPMYLAVLSLVAGQALALGQPRLLWYAGAVAAAMVAFVRLYEEPVLRARYGARYEAYRRAVPGWWPRLRPWEPGNGAGGPGSAPGARH